MSWKTMSMGTIAEGIYDGPHATPKKTSNGPVFLGISSLVDGRLDVTQSGHLSEEDFVRWTRRVTPEPGDLVFSYETRIGEAALIPDGLRCCLGRRMGLIRPDRSKVDPRFLLYAYLGRPFQETLRKHTVHGSTVDRILLTELPDFPISIPPLPEQRRIAAVLGALDDKIELNRRMNRTLEAMAQALFKSWFIDLDSHVDLVDSELGPIPRGWGVARLSDVTSKIGSGATPRGGSKAYVEEGTWFIRSQNVHDGRFVWSGLVKITDGAAHKLRGVTVESEDVLINITGDSILRTCVVDPDVLPSRVNQHVAILRADGIPPRFLHLWMVRPWMKSYLLGHSAGATRKAITKGHLQGTPIVLPPKSALREFEDRTRPFFKRIDLNRRENRTLAELRDALLPRLISGELRVPEADQLIEAAS